jgi:hypothetical protein
MEADRYGGLFRYYSFRGLARKTNKIKNSFSLHPHKILSITTELLELNMEQ